MNIDQTIRNLVQYGLDTGLLSGDDRIYATNLLLDCLHKDSISDPAEERGETPPLREILSGILEYAEEHGLTGGHGPVEQDLFDTRIMNCLMPRPSEVRRKFRALYQESPKAATDWYYRFSQDSNYIRRDRIEKDIRWKTKTVYGELDITINLSKPEKDPRAIAAAKNAPQSDYPKCQLCLENEGYAGRINHPARENHRVIPISLSGQPFYLQYSPYVYYNEHCIVFNERHIPMRIDRAAFEKLLGFVRAFPHYILGSNADLPIVGGSILSHDHFQGGNYEFPMARAEELWSFRVPGYEDVDCSVLHWPLSVIRIRSEESGRLVDLADHILRAWRSYTDEAAFLYAETEGEPHNTITPIARMRRNVSSGTRDLYELDLALRNNITTKEHPLGVYHPHSALHHIKKENIGLIEVMGLAILPARLREEMGALREAVLEGRDLRKDERTAKHADWAEEFLRRRKEFSPETAEQIFREEIGFVFQQVLEDAGVFKQTEEGKAAMMRFIDSL